MGVEKGLRETLFCFVKYVDFNSNNCYNETMKRKGGDNMTPITDKNERFVRECLNGNRELVVFAETRFMSGEIVAVKFNKEEDIERAIAFMNRHIVIDVVVRQLS